MIECHILEPDASLITVGHKENKKQVCFIKKDALLGCLDEPLRLVRLLLRRPCQYAGISIQDLPL